MNNLIVICADDMSYYKPPGVCPNIDRAAEAGFEFHNYHTNISICQPSRAVMMTGCYPMNNGCVGFGDDFGQIKQQPLSLILKQAGHVVSIMGKEPHYRPRSEYGWDNIIACSNNKIGPMPLGNGRDINLYTKYLGDVLQQPFAVFLNSRVPHRSFEKTPYQYQPHEFPGYIPDCPEYRAEYGYYLASVKKYDTLVGNVLELLDKRNLMSSTTVVITSDNGSPFPFCKGNCYHHSTHLPLVFTGAGVPQGESNALVSSIDLMPTICELLGLTPQKIDGQSLIPLMHGLNRKAMIHTSYIRGFHGQDFLTLACHTDQMSYILNLGGKEGLQGGTDSYGPFAAALEAKRPRRFRYLNRRPKEELFDRTADPNSINNLVGNRDYEVELHEMRYQLDELRRTAGVVLPYETIRLI
jgi:N-sulfoglucosamine sulfohydrolase